MSAPSSVEELLQLIRKSGMVEDSKLASYLQRRQVGRGLPPEPREAADAMIQDGILTHFQAEQFLLGKWRGFTIGKYKLLERVGVGGMGQVFLCEHMFMKRRVAVKVLPPAKAEQPAALGRFYREARAAGSLEHPNIVRTQDIDQDGNLHFIVMEYVDGSNLLEVVKKFGPMAVGRAASYCHQVALGLDYAFRAGIIHRDVKPGNVLIDRKGRAKVLDLGLARFFKDQNDLLTVKYDDKIVLGTADYVAPEQVANSHAVDTRADVYGLGATLYFLLAGHPPFPAGTVSQKLLWHRTKEPTPIRQIRPEIPEGLATVLATMMAKDPKQRYQTPADAAAALLPWVPASVPLPPADEMPQLCPAIVPNQDSDAVRADTLDLSAEATNEPIGLALASAAAAPSATAARSGVVSRTQPFAPGSGPFAPNSSSSRPANPLAPPAFPSGSRPGIGSATHPGLRSSVVQADDPLPTPAAYPMHPFAGTETPPEPKGFKWAVVAVVLASAVLGGGLAYWKFGPTPTPPAANGK